MSTISQDEIIELNSPASSKPITNKITLRRNKVSSPIIINQSPSISNYETTSDISELFTIKPPSLQQQQKLPAIKRRNNKRKKKLNKFHKRIDSESTQDTITDLSDDINFNNKLTSSYPNNNSPYNKSETKSYLEKINDRFKSIKENAGKSTKKVNLFRQTTEKIILDKVRKESNDIDAELELFRNKHKITNGQNIQDMYNFFCMENIQPVDNPELSTIKEEISPEGGDSTINLTEEESRNELVSFTSPDKLMFTINESEKELLFKINSKPVDLFDKINEDEIRDLADEGLYIPKTVNLSTKQINLLERRLLAHDDRRWFNCEGELDIIENPITKISIRPEKVSLPSEETTLYQPATIENQQEFNEIVIIQENILQLHIATLKFIHHPLFSIEHVLEQKLILYYKKYNQNIEHNTLTRIHNKIDALRHVINRNRNISDEDDNEEINTNRLTKINEYKKEIKTLQDLLFENGKNERENLKQILETWKLIKKIRKINKYSNTSIKLIINKEKVDYVEDKENWEKTINEFTKDLINEQQLIFKEKLASCKELKNDNNELDDEILPTEKPKFTINKEIIKENLQKQFQESFRSPGEPILHFTITNDNEISKKVEETKEILRRNAINSTKIFLKIISNKLNVCKSKSLQLKDNFLCEFNETFSIQFINIPKFITIEIIEQSNTISKRKIGEFIINLPLKNIFKDEKNIMKASFEKNEIIQYNKHEGVGSGIKIKSILNNYDLQIIDNNNDDNELNTNGYLTFNLIWENVNRTETINTNTEFNQIIDNIIDKYGAIQVDELKNWINDNKPDPQDPQNSILYQYSTDYDQDIFRLSKNDNNYFRLNPYMKIFEFCNINEIEDNIRLKMLELRNQNEPEFNGIIIPNRIKEINFNILADYKRRLESEKEGYFIDGEYDEEIYNNKRSYGQKYLKQIHIKIFQKCKNTENNLHFEDVVDEKFLLYFQKKVKEIVYNFINWFRWQPQIHQQLPNHLEHKIVEGETKIVQGNVITAKIIIKINSALNIPNRTKEISSDNSLATNDNNEVQPFIEVTYNNISIRSQTTKGDNPIWNEEIIVPLESLQTDYLSPNSLSGYITINVFDEIQKLNGNKIKNWLGYLDIPISAICYGSMIQGKFKLKVPHLLLGYEKLIDKQITKSPKITNNQITTNYFTYLDLMIKIEPNIPKLTPSIDELPCSDLPYIKEHTLKWNENYNYNYPNRKFSAFAIDTNGRTMCITRYIKPLEPPRINTEEFDLTPEQCTRFISLIPFTDCNHFYQNIWLSTDQLLHLMIGTIIDHAIALTCYLLALKLEVWLLLGNGIPNGSTAYVLIREYIQEMPVYSIFDVVNGEKYNLNDAYCPLQKIYCIVNSNNIWANTQRTDNISLTRFDFNRRSDWLTLFNNDIIAPTNSIHTKLTYTSEIDINEFQMQLDRKLRKKFTKMRPLNRTIWNHYVSNAFKITLTTLENNIMYGKNNYENLLKLNDVMSSYIIRGHTINLPYTNAATILSKIKSFGVHLVDDSNEFAFAIHLKCYQNQVISVWIFIASVKQK